MSDLEQVTALGGIDAVLDSLDKQLAKQRARVSNADAAIAAAQSEMRDRERAYKYAKEAERGTGREVERYQKSRQQAQRALDSGSGDAEVADRQVQQCSTIINDLEGKQLEQMEASEAADKAVDAARALLAAAHEQRAHHAEQAPPAIAKLVAKRAISQAQRDALLPKIHTEITNRYATLRRTKRTAVSLMQDSTCIPCRRTVPMQDASDIKRGFLKSCRACGRYLVLEIVE